MRWFLSIVDDPPANALFLISPANGNTFDTQIHTTNALTYEWAPDGTKLAIVNGGRVYTASSDGSNLVPVSDGTGMEAVARWSPASDRVLFQTDRDGDQEIYLSDPSGGTPTNITNDPAADVSGSWARCP